MQAGTRGASQRAIQANDQIQSRKPVAREPKTFTHDTLYQVTLYRALGQFFCNHHAEAGGIKRVWPIVHDKVAPFYCAPKSKNG